MSTAGAGAFTTVTPQFLHSRQDTGAQRDENGDMTRVGRRSERGSVLILVPAAVLVLLILGAISVDFSVAYLAKRQLQDTAATAVNDAAGAGLDEARLRSGDGRAALDPDAVRAAAVRAVHATIQGPVRLVGEPQVEIEDTTVIIRLEGEASYVFAPRTVHVRAEATAELVAE
jgi:Flp pilus assembly protein TadG